MFLPRPIFIANSNDEASYERPYSLFDVMGRAFFLSFEVHFVTVETPDSPNTRRF